MIVRRNLIAVFVAVAGALAALALALIPAAASADTCTVTIQVVTGQTYTFTVNVPPGTPVSQMNLPVSGKVVGESCVANSTSTPSASVTSSSTPTSTTTSTSPSSSSSGSTSTSSSTTTSPGKTHKGTGTGTGTSPVPSAPGRAQKQSTHTITQATKTAKSKSKKGPSAAALLPTGKGVPSPTNPTYSLSLPGPAAVGVPNFFIDSFRIPPFLIPIYQAAGIEYQVPWQILAAINEIETDYGRNLSTSTAGAVGWMQFLPSTWKTWGVDANGDGVADPYNPVDAIFTAARYLHAAGASQNVPRAIFAYNHATWYVQSVLLRAQLIGGIPSQLIGALTGLVQGHFPVAAPAKYADSNVVALAHRKVTGKNAALAINSTGASGTSIFAKKGSPVIAVNDGKIVKLGTTPQLGHFVELQDSTGNIYTYAHLGSLAARYPVPKPVSANSRQILKEFSIPAAKAPKGAASAGSQVAHPQAAPSLATASDKAPKKPTAPASAGAQPTKQASPAASAPSAAASSAASAAQGGTVSAPMVKERLFANPNRPASYASGGAQQIKNAGPQIANFHDYFSDTLHLAKNQYTLQPLHKGAIVVAGTVLGRIGGPSQSEASHLYFMIQPAGKKSPFIDPKPILDGWKLLEATAVYRADGVDPFFGPGAKDPSIGQVLLMSKQQLTARVLADPHVAIYPCGRRDIQAGLIDRRVLATIEFLSASGLDPDVTGLECGHSANGSTGTDAAGASGSSVDISKINDIPVLGHQGAGSIVDITMRRLLTLQGSMRPDEIISDTPYKGQSNTLALPDHKNRLQITFTPDYGNNPKLAKQIRSILQPGQWIQLINRIGQIPEPVVPVTPSKYALKAQLP